jgi:hypothetical protein
MSFTIAAPTLSRVYESNSSMASRIVLGEKKKRMSSRTIGFAENAPRVR